MGNYYLNTSADDWLSVADYRAATGDTTTSDADVRRAITRYLALTEGFLRRQLKAEKVTDVYRFVSAPILLRRYPVLDVHAIDADGSSIDVNVVEVNGESGVLFHNFGRKRKVQVTYTGGYEELPQDLKYVIFTLANSFIQGAVDDVRPVKKETVYGVQSIDYVTSSQMEGYGEMYAELGAYVSILERYRRADELGLA